MATALEIVNSLREIVSEDIDSASFEVRLEGCDCFTISTGKVSIQVDSLTQKPFILIESAG